MLREEQRAVRGSELPLKNLLADLNALITRWWSEETDERLKAPTVKGRRMALEAIVREAQGEPGFLSSSSAPCSHEDALQWQEVLWCKTCGAVQPLREAQDLPVGVWSLPRVYTKFAEKPADPAPLLQRIAQLLHFMNLLTATMQIESFPLNQRPQLLHGLHKHLAHDAQVLGLHVDDNTDLLLTFAQVSDALREITTPGYLKVSLR